MGDMIDPELPDPAARNKTITSDTAFRRIITWSVIGLACIFSGIVLDILNQAFFYYFLVIAGCFCLALASYWLGYLDKFGDKEIDDGSTFE